MPELTGYQIFALCCAAATPLSIYFIALVSRANDLDSDEDRDGPPTIIIMPPDDSVPKVDLQSFYRRWED